LFWGTLLASFASSSGDRSVPLVALPVSRRVAPALRRAHAHHRRGLEREGAFYLSDFAASGVSLLLVNLLMGSRDRARVFYAVSQLECCRDPDLRQRGHADRDANLAREVLSPDWSGRGTAGIFPLLAR